MRVSVHRYLCQLDHGPPEGCLGRIETRMHPVSQLGVWFLGPPRSCL